MGHPRYVAVLGGFLVPMLAFLLLSAPDNQVMFSLWRPRAETETKTESESETPERTAAPASAAPLSMRTKLRRFCFGCAAGVIGGQYFFTKTMTLCLAAMGTGAWTAGLAPWFPWIMTLGAGVTSGMGLPHTQGLGILSLWPLRDMKDGLEPKST